MSTTIPYKKRLFVEGKLKGLSNTEAAKAAGYSEKTAPQAGSRLAKDPDVVRLEIELRNPKNKNVKKTGARMAKKEDPKEVLIELMQDPDPAVALKAATALMPYVHEKLSAATPKAGKKETQKENAKKATNSGKFATLSKQSGIMTDKIQ